MSADAKTRTITLTGRRPVRITDSDWPTLASATGDSYGSRDYSRYQQALAQGECDTYSIRVRQHGDGRAIVYAILDGATAWTCTADHRGGEMLQPSADIAEAIARVGRDCGIPESVIRDCIADLPAEEV